MNNQNQGKILAFINTKPDARVEDICVGTKLSYITVKSELKGLLADEKIKEEMKGGVPSYTITDKGAQVAQKTEPAKKSAVKKEKEEAKPVAKAETKVTSKSPAKQVAKAKEDEDLGPKTFTGRDNTKYRFGEHRNLAKGRLALLLVKTYAEKNSKVSLSKLQELFHSAEIHPRFQVVEEAGKAKKNFSQGNRDRFFLKADDVFKVAGKPCAVCSQWTKESIDKLIKVASAHPIGFKVKVEAAE